MELFKSKGMKALTIALIASAALILAIIIITFSGASKRASKSDDTSTSDTESGTQFSPADLGYHDPSDTSTDASTNGGESTESTESAEPETEETTEEPKPINSLSFLSNGDGTCTVNGLGTYRSTEVDIPTLSPTGDIVTSISGYAFYNESSIVRISIPSTVRSIGEYAFLGCSSLIEISVSSNNTAFKTSDGILYSRDGTRLICCPPMRGKTTCVINKNVAVIESGAFAGVKNLKTVYYTGSAAEWTEINIYAHNELLDTVRLTCNYSENK